MADEALVPKDNGALVVPSRVGLLGGLEDFVPADLKLRYEARITRDGKWKIDREEVKEFRGVILRCTRFRKLTEGSDANTRTVCASTNGIVPQDDVAEPKAKRCTERKGGTLEPLCPFAEWTDAPDGKRIPPSCSEGLALMGIRLGTGRPFWIAATKTARLEVEALLGDMEAIPGAQRLHQFVVTCRVKQRKAPGRVWNVPDLIIEEGLLPLEQYAAHYQAAKDQRYVPWVSATSRKANEADGLPVGGEEYTDETVPF